MNRLKYLIAVLCITAFVPAAGFAIVDVAVYGGYSFEGKVRVPDPKGYELGGIAHANFMIPKIITLGIGAYYERAQHSYNYTFLIWKLEKRYSRDTVGLDGYVQLEVAQVVLPFARVSTSIWDNADGFREISGDNFFKTYAFGGGLAVPIFFKFQLYAEYLYTISKLSGEEVNSHAIHLGFRFKL